MKEYTFRKALEKVSSEKDPGKAFEQLA